MKNTFQPKVNGGGTLPPTCMRNLKLYLIQYCDSTSIHGIRYLKERGRFLIEKLIWCTIITTVCCLCVYLISKTYNKWVTQPVIVTFATTEIPVWKIPFPAITICPEVKSDPEKFNFTKFVTKGLPTKAELRVFQSVVLVCSTVAGFFGSETVKPPFANLRKVFYDHRESDLFLASWLGNELSTEDLSLTYTKEGLCYTFNMLNNDDILLNAKNFILQNSTNNRSANNWSLTNGYASDDTEYTFPKRSFIAGPDGGFQILLYTNHSHLDKHCGNFFSGFKIVLHHPAELPNMDRHFQLSLNQVLHVRIKPKLITVGKEIESYRPAERKCYYPDERRLAFYKNYSQKNCLSECLSNYTLRHCKCLGFYMVGIGEDTPICGTLSDKCLKMSRVKYALKQSTYNKGGEGSEFYCNCLPSCISLDYDVETSQSEVQWRSVLGLLKPEEITSKINYDRDHLSSLSVYYKDVQFLPVERHELYGYVDFFASSGGLMGLFIGISLTSLLEIIYFLTVRLACNIRKFGLHFWSGDPKLVDRKKFYPVNNV